MVGGYNVAALIELLKNSDEQLADCAAQGLSRTLLVYDAFNEVMDLVASNRFAKQVVDSWAEAEWFTITDRTSRIDHRDRFQGGRRNQHRRPLPSHPCHHTA